jgi:hypothetical protein
MTGEQIASAIYNKIVCVLNYVRKKEVLIFIQKRSRILIIVCEIYCDILVTDF